MARLLHAHQKAGRRARAHLALDVQEELRHQHTEARRLVIDDDRIWIAPEGVVSRDLETGELTELPVAGWRIDASVGITTDPRRRLTLVEERFLGVIREIAARKNMTEKAY